MRDQYRRLLNTHGPAIRRVCRGYERDGQRQAELQQDILLALWRALPSYRGDGSERAFVLRVAHNIAIKHVRREVRDAAQPGLDTEQVVSAGTAPDGQAARRQQRRMLQDAVLALPDPDRELVLLYLEGLESREIAEVTGLSPSNVTTRLSRLRARLRDALGDPP